MECPKCTSPRTKVVCTRKELKDEGKIIRRRQCRNCKYRWYSIQYPEVFLLEDKVKWRKNKIFISNTNPI